MATVSPLDEKLSPAQQLAHGGCFYEFVRRWSLDPNRPNTRTWLIVITVALAWAPLVVLAVGFGSSSGDIDLLSRVEPHARLLGTLGLLLSAELVLDGRVAMVADSVVVDGVARPASVAEWNADILTIRRWRDAWAFNLLWLALAYGAVLLAYVELLPAWLARWLLPTLHGAEWSEATAAWWWYVLIAQPLVLLVLLRWLHRWVSWGVLLWRLARLDLELRAVHADRAGGLGFTTIPVDALQLFILALSVALGSVWYDEIAAGRAETSAFAGDVVAFLAFGLTMMSLPYLGFTPRLIRARELAIVEYAALMRNYANEFERRWLAGSDRREDRLLGNADIAVLADLRSVDAGIDEMRSLVPSGKDLRAILIAAGLPLVAVVLAHGPSAVELIRRAIMRFFAN